MGKPSKWSRKHGCNGFKPTRFGPQGGLSVLASAAAVDVRCQRDLGLYTKVIKLSEATRVAPQDGLVTLAGAAAASLACKQQLAGSRRTASSWAAVKNELRVRVSAKAQAWLEPMFRQVRVCSIGWHFSNNLLFPLFFLVFLSLFSFLFSVSLLEQSRRCRRDATTAATAAWQRTSGV